MRRFADMFSEVLDLSAGLGILLLPLLTIALPGVILMLVAPAALLVVAAAVPIGIVGLILLPPYLLVRLFTRRRVSGGRAGSGSPRA